MWEIYYSWSSLSLIRDAVIFFFFFFLFPFFLFLYVVIFIPLHYPELTPIDVSHMTDVAFWQEGEASAPTWQWILSWYTSLIFRLGEIFSIRIFKLFSLALDDP
jgi:hypothetical protein